MQTVSFPLVNALSICECFRTIDTVSQRKTWWAVH